MTLLSSAITLKIYPLQSLKHIAFFEAVESLLLITSSVAQKFMTLLNVIQRPLPCAKQGS